VTRSISRGAAARTIALRTAKVNAASPINATRIEITIFMEVIYRVGR